jgi:hypothetical protein
LAFAALLETTHIPLRDEQGLPPEDAQDSLASSEPHVARIAQLAIGYVTFTCKTEFETDGSTVCTYEP